MHRFGHEHVEVYHIKYTPLEEAILDKYREDGTNYKVSVYAKAIVHKESEKVIGLHYAGPNAGEVMQGYAVAMKIGMTKQQLDSTIGIHPTCAEELTNMTVTKESGLPYEKTSC
ncbi:MAG: hypothetical protein KBC84_08770 [Proteobacteria bacterium]|nr:hypothetical protein [Pseudomonadota bacterium]